MQPFRQRFISNKCGQRITRPSKYRVIWSRHNVCSNAIDSLLAKIDFSACQSVAKRVNCVLLATIVNVLWIAPGVVRHRWQRANEVATVPKHYQSAVSVLLEREPLVHDTDSVDSRACALLGRLPAAA